MVYICPLNSSLIGSTGTTLLRLPQFSFNPVMKSGVANVLSLPLMVFFSSKFGNFLSKIPFSKSFWVNPLERNSFHRVTVASLRAKFSIVSTWVDKKIFRTERTNSSKSSIFPCFVMCSFVPRKTSFCWHKISIQEVLFISQDYEKICQMSQ